MTLRGLGKLYTCPAVTFPVMCGHNDVGTFDGGVIVKCSRVPKRRSITRVVVGQRYEWVAGSMLTADIDVLNGEELLATAIEEDHCC